MRPEYRLTKIIAMRHRLRDLTEHKPPRLEAEWRTADITELLDDNADLRSAVVDLVLLARRMCRRNDLAKRAELEKHCIRIGEKCGIPTPSILRGQLTPEQKTVTDIMWGPEDER